MSLPPIVKQWVTAQNGLENLVMKESPMRLPSLGEVLVRIEAVALNYRDTEVIMGLYTHHSTLGGSASSLVPCSDMCGTVVISHSPTWSPGDQVLSIFIQSHLTGQVKASDMKNGLGLPMDGVLQEYQVFSAEGLVRKPDYLTTEEACTLPIAGLTAWMAINGTKSLGPFRQSMSSDRKEMVLIQGTGGVSVSGLQIAKASGAEVIITSSSDSKLALAKSLGADKTINYKTTPDWDVEVMKMTDGEGVDIIFENGGAQTLRKSFECIAFGGLINCIGYLSGKEDPAGDRMNTNVLAIRRNVTLKGMLNGPRDRLEEMLGFYEVKKIKPVIDTVFEFEAAKEALKYLFGGKHFGKVVVRVHQ